MLGSFVECVSRSSDRWRSGATTARRWRCRARRNGCSWPLLAAGAPGVVSTDRLVETLWNGDRPAERAQVAAGPPRPPAQRAGAGPAAGLDRAATSSVGAPATRWRRPPTTSTPCGIGDLAARGRALGWPRATPAEAERLLCAAALGLWRGEPYARLAGRAVRRDGAAAAGRGAGRRRWPALLEARLALGRHAEVVAGAGAAASPRSRCGRSGGACWCWRSTAPAGRAMRWPRGAGPGGARRASSAPIPVRGCARLEAAVLAQDPALDARRRRAGPPPAGRTCRTVCPYKGLAAYQVDRRRAVPRPRAAGRPGWWRGWSTHRCWSSPGPSGAGKSSLVRAGLVPALARRRAARQPRPGGRSSSPRDDARSTRSPR